MEENKEEQTLEEDIQEIEESEEVVEEPVEVKPEVNKESVPHNLPKKLVEQPKRIGAPIPGKIDRLKAFIVECKRVLRVTKKPDKQEFLTIVKISAIGMGVIGIIGFIVHFLKEFLL